MVGKDRGGDAGCIHCGAPIYFDVGPPGVLTCPACGKDWQHTDEEVEQRRREMETPTDWVAELTREVDSLIFSCLAVVEAPDEVEVDIRSKRKAYQLIELANQMKKALRAP